MSDNGPKLDQLPIPQERAQSGNPYEILGVPNRASQDEIDKAARNLKGQYAPDRNTGDVQAAIKLQEVHSAYNLIKDKDARSVYHAESLSDLAKAVSDFEEAKLIIVGEKRDPDTGEVIIDKGTGESVKEEADVRQDVSNLIDMMLDSGSTFSLDKHPAISLEDFDKEFENSWARYPDYSGWHTKLHNLLLEEYRKRNLIKEDSAKIDTKLVLDPNSITQVTVVENPPIMDMKKLASKPEVVVAAPAVGAGPGKVAEIPMTFDFERMEKDLEKEQKEIDELKSKLAEKPEDALTSGSKVAKRSLEETFARTQEEADVENYLPDDVRQYQNLLADRERYERLLASAEERGSGKATKKLIKSYEAQIEALDYKIEVIERSVRWAKEDYLNSPEDYEDRIKKLNVSVKKAQAEEDQTSVDRLLGQIDRLEEKVSPSWWKKTTDFAMKWTGLKAVSGALKWCARRAPVLTSVLSVGLALPHAIKELNARYEHDEREMPRWAEKIDEASKKFTGPTGKRHVKRTVETVPATKKPEAEPAKEVRVSWNEKFKEIIEKNSPEQLEGALVPEKKAIRQEALADCRGMVNEMIEHYATSNLNDIINKLEQVIKQFDKTYAFDEDQKSILLKHIGRYKIEKEKAMVVFEKPRENNVELLNTISERNDFTEDEAKKVKISVGPWGLAVEVDDTDLANKITKKVGKKVLGGKGFTGGFSWMMVNKNQEVRKGKKDQSGKLTAKHENSHLQFGDRSRSKKLKAQELLNEYAENQNENEEGAKKYFTAKKEEALIRFADEFIAMAASNSLESLRVKVKLFFDPESLYNFVRGALASAAADVHSKIAKEILVNEYRVKVEKSVIAMYNLIEFFQKKGWDEKGAINKTRMFLSNGCNSADE